MKKIFVTLFLCLLVGIFAKAQNGLERIYVERYYVSNAADQVASGGDLPVGSVTYRIYADLLPGYSAQIMYAVTGHPLKMTTSTSFYNNTSGFGVDNANAITANNNKKNTVMLDSWLSTGAACVGYLGIPKNEDNTTGNFVVTGASALQNNDASAGDPLTLHDGLIAGTTPTFGQLGLDAYLPVFGDGSANGNSFIVPDGSWFNLNGSTGATASNMVLIAQITTNGIFHFELNMQVKTPTPGVVQKFVANSPGAGEIRIPSLTQTLYPTPQFPIISLTSPANNATFPIGALVSLSADASDVDGNISQVEFFVDGVSAGIDASAPYSVSYTGMAEATHTLTAKATDNEGHVTTSLPSTFLVGNSAPTVTASVSAPVNGTNYLVGDIITLSASANDPDGTVAAIQFYVDGLAVGSPISGATQTFNASLPYTAILGSHSVTARATDNNGKSTTSLPVVLAVDANKNPIVSIDAPLSGSKPDVDADLVISAQATDADGTITSVEFYKGGVSLGTGSKAGNVYSLTVPKAQLVLGPMAITAVATDNKGGVTTSAQVNVTITNFNIAYAIDYVNQPCHIGSVCLPVTAVTPVSGVIGYNFNIKYDKTKIVPTGNVTVQTDLLGGVLPSLTTVDTYIDAAAGTIAVSIYFKGSAPVTAAFNGTGKLCCIEFNQTATFTGDDEAIFSFNGEPVTESYPTQVIDQPGQDGKFTIYKDWFLNANLKNWSDNQPIKYDSRPGHETDYLVSNILGSTPQVGAAGAAVKPDLNGTFRYDIRNGLTIDIQRDIDNSTLVNSIIEGNDAHLASIVSLGYPAFRPEVYSIVAMDVNRDQRITAGDATQINRRSVNLVPEFTQVGGEHKDWLFVSLTEANNNPAYKISATYPQNDGLGYSRARVPYISKFQNVKFNADYLVCPELLSSEDYLGVMLGDADGTYAAKANDGKLKSVVAENSSEIVIDLSKAMIVNGDIQLPVSLKSAEAITSYSFQLTLKDHVKVNAIVSTVNANLDWNYIPEYKALLVSTYTSGVATIPNTSTVANITVQGMGSINPSDLTGVISKINGKDANILVVDATLGVPEQGKDNLVKVYPNPATDKVNIETSVDSKMLIFDFNGKQVAGEQNVSANQKQSVDVSNLVPGVYMIKVYNDKFVKVQKVVIKK